MKNELEKLLDLYIKERKNFSWLISFEEFEKDYVVKCEHCGEYFVTDMNDTMCEECLENLEEVQENDSDWVYFEDNKEHYVYGLY